MTPELLLALFRYNWWAHGRLLEAAGALPPADVTRDLGGSLHSVRETLLHTLWVELMFMRRWRGLPASDMPSPPTLDSVAAIAATWQDLEGERASYLAQLTPADLDRPVSYTDSRGRAISLAMWQTLLHVVNHSTYHRGQVASQLRQLGRVPPATDYTAFCLEMP